MGKQAYEAKTAKHKETVDAVSARIDAAFADLRELRRQGAALAEGEWAADTASCTAELDAHMVQLVKNLGKKAKKIQVAAFQHPLKSQILALMNG